MYAHSNPNTHCDAYTYSYGYANRNTDVDRNCDYNPDCNDYAHNYTEANACTKSFSDAAAAPYAGAKTVIPRVINEW